LAVRNGNRTVQGIKADFLSLRNLQQALASDVKAIAGLMPGTAAGDDLHHFQLLSPFIPPPLR